MKKILYMNMLWLNGGIEAYMLNVFDHIDRSQFLIDVALPGEFRWENESKLNQRDIHVIHYPIGNLRQQIQEIKKILAAGDYDIVHIMQSYVALEPYMVFALVALAERKHYHYKVICHAHGTEDKTRAIGSIKKVLRSAFRAALRKSMELMAEK